MTKFNKWPKTFVNNYTMQMEFPSPHLRWRNTAYQW